MNFPVPFLRGAFLTLLTGLLVASVEAAPPRVLPADFNADKTEQMMRSYLRREVHAALDRRLAEFEKALRTPAGREAYQAKRRDYLAEVFAGPDRRGPLNAAVTSVIQADGFTIEKVRFESRPGFHVTANLYRPAGPGPFPAVLHPCGHSANGKAYAQYQKANRLLVRHGFVVLCFDPVGQGERRQIRVNGVFSQRATGEHQHLGVAPVLLGSGLGPWMVWDAVRALDYLGGRADVDADRMGCTGNSGGGNLTSFLMAHDDRIRAAAPGCFMTTHRRKNESPGPGDAEQNLFGQIARGFDHPDFMITRAPVPVCILSATRDFVPIAGTWEAYRQAKRFYTALGFPERVELVEANEKHGFTRRLREAAVRFFARWLQGRNLEVREAEAVTVLPDEALRVTQTGQVLDLPGARSAVELYVEQARALAATRKPVTREQVRAVTGIRSLAELPLPRVERIAATATAIVVASGPQRIVLHPEPGIALPALFWAGGERRPVVMAVAAVPGSVVDEAERLHAAGHPVLVVNVRDTGETATRNWRFPGADQYIAHMLGRCWPGMQAEDLLVAARWLRESSGGRSVRVMVDATTGVAARHAAALEPELVSELELNGGLRSWRELVGNPIAWPQLPTVVRGGLRHYDLPDLEELCTRVVRR